MLHPLLHTPPFEIEVAYHMMQVAYHISMQLILMPLLLIPHLFIPHTTVLIPHIFDLIPHIFDLITHTTVTTRNTPLSLHCVCRGGGGGGGQAQEQGEGSIEEGRCFLWTA